MVDILNTTKQKTNFDNEVIFDIKNTILGKNYELSIVIVGDKKIQNLNKYEKDQISSFATYGNVEWEKYFADRYK